METKKIYHINDRTHKYKAIAQAERLHTYVRLPGEFEARYPQEVVLPNMVTGYADDYHSSTTGILIDLEEESGIVTEEIIKKKYKKYVIFGEFMYSKQMYLAVICHKDPKNFPTCVEVSPSFYIKVHYIYFPQDELEKKYENIINKVEQKVELSEEEALDMAFVPKFISKKRAPFITESLSLAYKDAIISDEVLKRDVGVILGAMILKNVNNNRQNRLLEEIDMKQIDKKISQLVEDEYGDSLRKFKQKNLQLEQENSKIKEGLEKITKKHDLSPELLKDINLLIYMG